jgi:pentatricopeptide repeat protein
MRAGDLEGGLRVLARMTENNIKPDITTFTTLISTVGVPRSQTSAFYGSNDPDVAFQLFERLRAPPYNLSPNGKTYCALINVCSRVRRPDLALRTLRIMTNEGWGEGGSKVTGHSKYVNQNIKEAVGAWTATIDTCGKSDRVDTAMSLFNNMVSSSVISPNEITCSCLFDVLLKNDKISDALDVIKYMKSAKLEPTDYMYTGMLSVASRMLENEEEISREVRMDDGDQFSLNRLVQLTHPFTNRFARGRFMSSSCRCSRRRNPRVIGATRGAGRVTVTTRTSS